MAERGRENLQIDVGQVEPREGESQTTPEITGLSPQTQPVAENVEQASSSDQQLSNPAVESEFISPVATSRPLFKEIADTDENISMLEERMENIFELGDSTRIEAPKN